MSLQSLRIRCFRLYFFVLNVVGTLSAANVFYECRDKDIQYYGSNFAAFNCSKPNEVIYVESAIIGFTPLYKADNNVLECPITADTCTKATQDPSALCNGHIECTLAQRILQYSQSGLQCSLNGTTTSSLNLGGNFININYSCISRELCFPVPGYIRRYTCSAGNRTSVFYNSFSVTTPTTATNSSDHVTTIETVTHQYTQLSPIIVSGHSLSAGVIAAAVVAGVVSVSAIIGVTVILFRKRKKRKRETNNNPLPLAEDLTDPPKGDWFSHQPQPHSTFVGSLNEVHRDETTYEKLNRPNELSPVYYNQASPDNNYQRLQLTNQCSLVSQGGPSNNLN